MLSVTQSLHFLSLDVAEETYLTLDCKSLFYTVGLPTLDMCYLKERKLHREITDAKSALRK